MNSAIFFTVALFVWVQYQASAAPSNPPQPANPCDIVDTISHIIIPRIEIHEPTTLRESLDFIYSRINAADDIDDPQRRTKFVFEYRLAEATLRQHVSFKGKNIKITQALKLALKDTAVALTFESGKLILTQIPAPHE